MLFMRIMDRLLPDGLGTKAILALIIVGYGITKLSPESLEKVVILVVTAYFVLKAARSGQKEKSDG